MNNNNNNKKSKAERRAQSQRDKANAKAAKGGNSGKGNQRPRKQKQAAAAAAYATGQVGKAPVIKMSRDTCRIVHRELIASVTGSTLFAVLQSFALNPGLAATFPWLSVMAAGWEQYRFRSLKFCYYTRTGSNVPGSVLLAPDYDAADAAPATEQIACAFEDVAEDAPWKDIECALTKLSMAGGTSRHFTRTGALAANLDIKTYDVGNLHLCAVDGTEVPWGKLWVEYDVEFFVPQLPPTGVPVLTGGEIQSGAGTTAANPIGTAPVISALSAGFSVSIDSTITFATAGTYLVTLLYDGTTITAGVAPVLSAGATQTGDIFSITAGGGGATEIFGVNVTAPNATVKFAITAAAVASTFVQIAQAPAGSLV